MAGAKSAQYRNKNIKSSLKLYSRTSRQSSYKYKPGSNKYTKSKFEHAAIRAIRAIRANTTNESIRSNSAKSNRANSKRTKHN